MAITKTTVRTLSNLVCPWNCLETLLRIFSNLSGRNGSLATERRHMPRTQKAASTCQERPEDWIEIDSERRKVKTESYEWGHRYTEAER